MRRSSALAATIVSACLALAASSALANRSLALSASRELGRVTAGGRFTFTEDAVGYRISCELTFRFTLHRSIAKIVGASVGSVVDVRASRCSGGTVVVLSPRTDRPWPVRYNSFRGTLPNITEVVWDIELVNNQGFLFSVFFGLAQCLYGGTGAFIRLTNRGNPITQQRVDESRTIALFSEALSPVMCPDPPRLAGTFAALDPPITIMLI